MKFKKPRIFASKCLGFDACRWNGVTIRTEWVDALQPYVEFVTNCPEAEIGLGIPRPPIRIIEQNGKKTLYQPDTDSDFTDLMNSYVKDTLDSMPAVDGFILKTRSPSCGPYDVKKYPEKGKVAASGKTTGFFGGEILKRFGALAVEDEGRLKNFTLREAFFIRIFTLAEFRHVKASGKISKLMEFQAKHKLLLMSLNQSRMRAMGKLVANHEKLSFDKVVAEYEKQLVLALKNGPRPSNAINVLMHALGYFKKELHSQEKKFYLELLESYKNRTVPLSAPVSVMKSWIIKYDENYLAKQSFFEPYPEQLITISDSGKGRDYQR